MALASEPTSDVTVTGYRHSGTGTVAVDPSPALLTYSHRPTGHRARAGSGSGDYLVLAT